jgi:hypothetical protein
MGTGDGALATLAFDTASRFGAGAEHAAATINAAISTKSFFMIWTPQFAGRAGAFYSK